MDNAGYTTLTRQSGLMREMQMIAHNVANSATQGYRSENMVFSEHVKRLDGDDAPSLSMAEGNTFYNSDIQGGVSATGGKFDFAIEGDGYFLIETPDGEALTRAGNFTPSAEGELVTADGLRVLDAGGAPIFIPPNAAISVASDGTISADDQPIAQLGLWRPGEITDVTRREGVLFDLTAAPVAVENGVILQGHLEGSNVDPIAQIARMIEVQRAYEMGQSFLEKEDGRIRAVLTTLGR
ncbi:flagellar hook-basal body complex protein [Palleronia sp. LCG004]|uniref:flagellar hook-basal body complex protein n=1 Tax=Palleronia sp. LCG004 TaxID=3079304 RepID=UPI0029426C57|nr:flagellar hook-basal body complex protein [Palleronia sp. LCG004]WOI56191.1 flagellar hook-basal body complex protein [Palleronia sp. LCG004]